MFHITFPINKTFTINRVIFLFDLKVSRLTPLIGSLNTTTTAASTPSNTTTSPLVSSLTTNTKGPLREQQQQQTVGSNIHISSLNNVSKSLLSGKFKNIYK